MAIRSDYHSRQLYNLAFSDGTVATFEYAGEYAGHEMIWVGGDYIRELGEEGIHIDVKRHALDSYKGAVIAQEFRFATEKLRRMRNPGYGLASIASATTACGTATMAYVNTACTSTPSFKKVDTESEKKKKKHEQNISKLLIHRKLHENRRTTKS